MSGKKKSKTSELKSIVHLILGFECEQDFHGGMKKLLGLDGVEVNKVLIELIHEFSCGEEVVPGFENYPYAIVCYEQLCSQETYKPVSDDSSRDYIKNDVEKSILKCEEDPDKALALLELLWDDLVGNKPFSEQTTAFLKTNCADMIKNKLSLCTSVLYLKKVLNDSGHIINAILGDLKETLQTRIKELQSQRAKLCFYSFKESHIPNEVKHMILFFLHPDTKKSIKNIEEAPCLSASTMDDVFRTDQP